MSIGDAAGLFIALPLWFFVTILVPFGAGLFSAIPAAGVLSLAFGVVLGLIRRDRRLLLFIIPAALSQALVTVAGAFRGRLTSAASQPILLGFLVLQLLMVGYLIYRARDSRLAGLALGLFSLSYALFAAFVAAMAFTNTWL